MNSQRKRTTKLKANNVIEKYFRLKHLKHRIKHFSIPEIKKHKSRLSNSLYDTDVANKIHSFIHLFVHLFIFNHLFVCFTQTEVKLN